MERRKEVVSAGLTRLVDPGTEEHARNDKVAVCVCTDVCVCVCALR